MFRGILNKIHGREKVLYERIKSEEAIAIIKNSTQVGVISRINLVIRDPSFITYSERKVQEFNRIKDLIQREKDRYPQIRHETYIGGGHERHYFNLGQLHITIDYVINVN